MNRKKFILTIVVPVAVSIIIGIIIIIFSNSFIIPSKVRVAADSEKSRLGAETAELQKQKEELEKQIEAYDNEISKCESLLTEIQKRQDTLEDYESELEETKEKIAGLDKQIEEKNNILNALSDVKEETEGESKELDEGEYKCPADIAAGRYTIEGDAKIYLYSLANTLSKKEDLSTLDTHSFKLEITSGESLKVEGGKVTLKSIETK
ncbi:MAG: coiled-coil domain-containing protein [Candidatus Ornithomonoglobus sp.]